jgi:hypothetical protein
VRYADDCNVYVRSEQAGLRVMASLTRRSPGCATRLTGIDGVSSRPVRRIVLRAR